MPPEWRPAVCLLALQFSMSRFAVARFRVGAASLAGSAPIRRCRTPELVPEEGFEPPNHRV